MKRIAGLLCVAAVLAVAGTAFAQTDLSVFPIGTTKMVYKLRTEDMTQPMPLELSVTVHGDGTYTVRMVTEGTGTEDELGSFGFIGGMTSVSASGQDVSYTSLQALMDQRNRLQEGQEYLLPGGGAFTNIVGATIAGVWCLQGTLVDPDNADIRTTVAFALSKPVYISPLIRVEELRSGQWVETFSLELVEYTLSGS
ncbi:MAG: hypothetical protein NTY63_09680 [Candidatus Bipolaricaulota bacterium]|nr:hypothetical protein [Candidatus Bipolaricaulota bacterium]